MKNSFIFLITIILAIADVFPRDEYFSINTLPIEYNICIEEDSCTETLSKLIDTNILRTSINEVLKKSRLHEYKPIIQEMVKKMNSLENSKILIFLSERFNHDNLISPTCIYVMFNQDTGFIAYTSGKDSFKSDAIQREDCILFEEFNEYLKKDYSVNFQASYYQTENIFVKSIDISNSSEHQAYFQGLGYFEKTSIFCNGKKDEQLSGFSIVFNKVEKYLKQKVSYLRCKYQYDE